MHPTSYIMKLHLSLSFLLLIHCAYAQDLEPKEGFVPVEGGSIWYKVVGSGKQTPLLIIHGGPGGNSCRSIAGYANSAIAKDRALIFYDQLSSGRSDKANDTLLWKLHRFVNEINALREELDLKEVHMLGSSWGAAIAVEYLLTKKPKGVKSIVFSGPLLSTPMWIADAKILVGQLPKPMQDTLWKYEHIKLYEHPSYLAANDSFNVRYGARNKPSNPSPQCTHLKRNRQLYNYMWGPTEFTCTGTLRNFDRFPRLKELKLPVLFVAGEFDEARPETMLEFQKQVPGSKVEITKGAGHAQLNDNPLDYTNSIARFLKSLEKK